MTKDELIEFHKNACDKMHETLKRKNADYTGMSTDPFANFTTAEDLGICSTEQGFLVRLTDKFKRIITFVKKGVLLVADETVEDTLFDMANYCIIMAAFVRSKKNDNK